MNTTPTNVIPTIHHLIALKLWLKRLQGGNGRVARRSLLIVRGSRQDELGRTITLVSSPHAHNFYHPRPRSAARPRKPAPAFHADLVARQKKARPYPGDTI